MILLRVALWFAVGWLCSGGFSRIALAVFHRTGFRGFVLAEIAVFRLVCRLLSEGTEGL